MMMICTGSSLGGSSGSNPDGSTWSRYANFIQFLNGKPIRDTQPTRIFATIYPAATCQAISTQIIPLGDLFLSLCVKNWEIRMQVFLCAPYQHDFLDHLRPLNLEWGLGYNRHPQLETFHFHLERKVNSINFHPKSKL